MPYNVWICDFCDFQDESKSKVEKHEEQCMLNPINQEVETEEE